MQVRDNLWMWGLTMMINRGQCAFSKDTKKNMDKLGNT